MKLPTINIKIYWAFAHVYICLASTILNSYPKCKLDLLNAEWDYPGHIYVLVYCGSQWFIFYAVSPSSTGYERIITTCYRISN